MSPKSPKTPQPDPTPAPQPPPLTGAEQRVLDAVIAAGIGNARDVSAVNGSGEYVVRFHQEGDKYPVTDALVALIASKTPFAITNRNGASVTIRAPKDFAAAGSGCPFAISDPIIRKADGFEFIVSEVRGEFISATGSHPTTGAPLVVMLQHHKHFRAAEGEGEPEQPALPLPGEISLSTHQRAQLETAFDAWEWFSPIDAGLSFGACHALAEGGLLEERSTDDDVTFRISADGCRAIDRTHPDALAAQAVTLPAPSGFAATYSPDALNPDERHVLRSAAAALTLNAAEGGWTMRGAFVNKRPVVERLVARGLLEEKREALGFGYWRITEAGARAIGEKWDVVNPETGEVTRKPAADLIAPQQSSSAISDSPDDPQPIAAILDAQPPVPTNDDEPHDDIGTWDEQDTTPQSPDDRDALIDELRAALDLVSEENASLREQLRDQAQIQIIKEEMGTKLASSLPAAPRQREFERDSAITDWQYGERVEAGWRPEFRWGSGDSLNVLWTREKPAAAAPAGYTAVSVESARHLSTFAPLMSVGLN